MRFPEYASFSVLRETSVPFSSYHFKNLKCYQIPYQVKGIRKSARFRIKNCLVSQAHTLGYKM
jgi:hypothetical protein